MNTDELLRRADAWLAEDAWWLTEEGVPYQLVRDLAAALRAEREIAEKNYASLSDALHTEQDRTHRYHERAERAEVERDEWKRKCGDANIWGLQNAAAWKDRAERAEAALENERMKVAACSTAAFGYWKEGDTLHPDYECAAIHDVAKLYRERDEARALLREARKYLDDDGSAWTDPIVTRIDALLKDKP